MLLAASTAQGQTSITLAALPSDDVARDGHELPWQGFLSGPCLTFGLGEEEFPFCTVRLSCSTTKMQTSVRNGGRK